MAMIAEIGFALILGPWATPEDLADADHISATHWVSNTCMLDTEGAPVCVNFIRVKDEATPFLEEERKRK